MTDKEAIIQAYNQPKMMEIHDLRLIALGIDLGVDQAHYIVEIGVYHGQTTCFLSAYTQATKGFIPEIVTIDPFDDATEDWEQKNIKGAYEAFTERIHREGIHEHIIRIIGPSQKAHWALEFDAGLIVVDGAHTYEAVLLDCIYYKELVKPGGCIFFHDFCSVNYPGVVQAVEENMQTDPRFEVVAVSPTSILFQRKK